MSGTPTKIIETETRLDGNYDAEGFAIVKIQAFGRQNVMILKQKQAEN